MSAPGHEGALARPRQDDDAHRRVGLVGGDDLRHGQPHLVGDGIVLLGLIENHPADAILNLRPIIFAVPVSTIAASD